jgi:hypothetical protein
MYFSFDFIVGGLLRVVNAVPIGFPVDLLILAIILTAAPLLLTMLLSA